MSRRVLVLSDTHMPRRGRELPSQVLQALQGADLVVHLGDFTGVGVAEMLEGLAPLYGVHGNNDDEDVRARFPESQRISVNGHSLVLIHGDKGGRTALEAARRTKDADAVLFGHSHRAYCREEDGRLMFNPGSPTDPRWSPSRSFGLLEVGERIEPSIIAMG